MAGYQNPIQIFDKNKNQIFEQILMCHSSLKKLNPEKSDQELLEMIMTGLSKLTPLVWIYDPVKDVCHVFDKGNIN